jgi:hypothetical protein
MARASRAGTHERLAQSEPVAGGTNRAFGFVFAVVFTIVGAWPLLRGAPPRWWGFVAAAIFLTLALLRPRALAPLNRAWLRIGRALHAVVSPAIMALIYYSTVTPIGLLLRLSGKDLLRLRFEPESPTYWIERLPPGPAPPTMPRQF